MIKLFDFCNILLDERLYIVINVREEEIIVDNPQGIKVEVSKEIFYDLLDFDNVERIIKNVKSSLVSPY